MDPILITVVVVLIILVLLKIFFGIAKLFFKLGVLILIAVIIWRLVMMRG